MFEKDRDLQDIVMLNLERVVQNSVEIAMSLISEKGWTPIPATMAAALDVIYLQNVISADIKDNLKKAASIRDIAVLEYDKINWAIVYRILKDHLKDFRKFGKIVDAI